MSKFAVAAIFAASSLMAGAAMAQPMTAPLQKDTAVAVQPGVGAKTGALDAGTLVNVVDVNGEWAHIQTPTGVDGWVPTAALRQPPL